MHNSSVFAEEFKMSLTKVATMLAEANSKCFTVCFTTKVDDKMVAEKLAAVKAKPNADAARALAKDLLTGKETTVVGRLSRAEGRLGRSLESPESKSVEEVLSESDFMYCNVAPT